MLSQSIFHCLGVQVREWLVEEEDGWLADDRSIHRDPLSLAPRKGPRFAVKEGMDPQHLCGNRDSLVDLGFGQLAKLEAEGHVIVDRHVGIERVVLKDHGDISVLGGKVVDHPVADVNGSLSDLFQPSHHTECGGFATARGADQHQELAIGDLQGKIPDRDDVVKPFCQVLEEHLCHGFPLPACRKVIRSHAFLTIRNPVCRRQGQPIEGIALLACRMHFGHKYSLQRV